MIKFATPTKSKYKTKTYSNANRGMDLENDINKSNLFYNTSNIGVITKRPTPIRVVHMDYKNNIITKAYFEKQSTTDYNGIYKGRYIDFEAKSTNNKSLPLNNIPSHQLEHLSKVVSHGVIAFFIISFKSLNKNYFITYEILKDFISSTNRKSISVKTIEEKGMLINTSFKLPLDYLKCVDEIYFKK